jgi:hypothetical protein
MSPARNRNSVLWGIHMTIDDVVLAAHKNTRRAVEALRRSYLTPRNLD